MIYDYEYFKKEIYSLTTIDLNLSLIHISEPTRPY